MQSDVALTREEMLRFIEELGSESPRGCALVAGAWLEDRLGEVIRAHLVDDPKTVNDLLGGAFGSFGARIGVAFALGLITRDERDALEAINFVRNAAAHPPRPKLKRNQASAKKREVWTDFDAPIIKEKCKGMKPGGMTARAMSARNWFSFVVSFLVARFDSLAQVIKHTPERAPGWEGE